MTNLIDNNIDQDTISKIGLTEADKSINSQLAPDARIFNYPGLENIFIMESDLYGNTMPKDSCFLAFYGTHGLIGKHLKVETLRNSTMEGIQSMVDSNCEG